MEFLAGIRIDSSSLFGSIKVINMYQNVILEPISPQLKLSLNIENVDWLFPGFMLGDFAVLHGSSSIQSLLSSLCVLSLIHI